MVLVHFLLQGQIFCQNSFCCCRWTYQWSWEFIQNTTIPILISDLSTISTSQLSCPSIWSLLLSAQCILLFITSTSHIQSGQPHCLNQISSSTYLQTTRPISAWGGVSFINFFPLFFFTLHTFVSHTMTSHWGPTGKDLYLFSCFTHHNTDGNFDVVLFRRSLLLLLVITYCGLVCWTFWGEDDRMNSG